MNLFAINLTIALGWVAVAGTVDATNLLLGYVGGFAGLWATRQLYGPNRYFERTFAAIGLVLFFLYDLVRSSVGVIWDIITPEMLARPRMIEVPLDAESDLAIMLTANLVSLTPGTLSIDVSPDRKRLLVHAMFADAPDEVVHDLKDGMERRILEALR
ncbi:MAG: Na+/H+ antiporter subunit E [Pseudomonadota bacterium]